MLVKERIVYLFSRLFFCSCKAGLRYKSSALFVFLFSLFSCLFFSIHPVYAKGHEYPRTSTSGITPVVSWDFEEQSALVAADSSGNNHNAAVVGGIKRKVSGKTGSGFIFDGVNVYLYSRLDAVNFTKYISISLWVKTSSRGSIMGFTNTLPAGRLHDKELFIDNNGRVCFRVYPNGTIVSAVSITDGNWHNIVAVFGFDSGMALYIDGRQEARSASAGECAGYNGYITLGIQGQDSRKFGYFKGVMDEVRIFSGVLTEENVKNFYVNGDNIAKVFTFADSRIPSNSPLWVQDSSGNRALSFNGVNDYVYAPLNAEEFSQALTIALWIKTGSSGSVVGFSNNYPLGAIHDKEIVVDTNGNVRFRLYPQGVLISNSKVNDNCWHHIAAAYDSNSGMRVYIDGKLDKINLVNGASYAYKGFLTVGIQSQDSHIFKYFHGLIGRLKIANSALSEQEIEALFAGEKSSLPAAIESPHALTVNSAHGKVGVSPLLKVYPAGTKVILKVVSSSPGYTFTGWSGDAAGSDSMINVVMDRDRVINACFEEEKYTLNISFQNGKIQKSPDKDYYAYGDAVEITAIPGPGYKFIGWDGDSGLEDKNKNPLNVAMTANKQLNASFGVDSGIALKSNEYYSLTVIAENGSVAKDPEDGDSADGKYGKGRLVILTASPDNGYVFSNWSLPNGSNKSQNSYFVTMDSDKVVTANFSEVSGNILGPVYITKDTVLDRNKVYTFSGEGQGQVIVIGADNITLDCDGAVIEGKKAGDIRADLPGSFDAPEAEWEKNVDIGDDYRGYGIVVKGRNNVTIRNCNCNHLRYGLYARDSQNLKVLGNNFSNNYTHNFGWLGKTLGPMGQPDNPESWEYGGGIYLENAGNAYIAGNTLRNQFNGIDLYNVNESTILRNDVSHNFGWGIHLYNSNNNRVTGNDASYVNRGMKEFPNSRCDKLEASTGWPYTKVGCGGDAAAVLLISSSGNIITYNDLRYGANGLFLSADDGQWVAANFGSGYYLSSTCNYNYVAHNDGSYSPHNGFEVTFSHDNVIYANTSIDSRYGFWIGPALNTRILLNRSEGSLQTGLALPWQSLDNLIAGNTIINSGMVRFAEPEKSWDVRYNPDDGFGINFMTPTPAPHANLIDGYGTVVVGNIIEHNPRGIGLNDKTGYIQMSQNTIKNNWIGVETANVKAGTGKQILVENNAFTCNDGDAWRGNYNDSSDGKCRYDISNNSSPVEVINTGVNSFIPYARVDGSDVNIKEGAGFPSAQDWINKHKVGYKKVVDSGDPKDKINIVIYADGFLLEDKFEENELATCLGNYKTGLAGYGQQGFFEIEPFKTNRNKFNVYLVSNSEKKYAGCVNGGQCDTSRIFADISAQVEAVDYVVIIVKNEYGGFTYGGRKVIAIGSGKNGEWKVDPVTRRSGDLGRVFPHEFAHALGVGDEWVYEGAGESAEVPVVPNCDVAGCPKWRGMSGIECVPGCGHSNWYRPVYASIMNSFGNPEEINTFSKPAEDWMKAILDLYPGDNVKEVVDR